MLTYTFENREGESLYEYLYRRIKEDILAHTLMPDEKLPSKRALAKNLNISTVTVETAYSQLCAEGYLYSIPKRGYYVAHVEAVWNAEKVPSEKVSLQKEERHQEYFADFVNNGISSENFPFATWSKLMRETISENAEKLMVRSPSSGVFELRLAIRDYLYQFRGIHVEPEQIIVGAGTEYLYGLIIQLLGHGNVYGIEDPGYQKIARIYEANHVQMRPIPLDSQGIDITYLEKTDADVIHISPSHHFPTGLVTPVQRRYELLAWASKDENRYIIEDDYDSEFRLSGKPIPPMQCIDSAGKVIYINTFSKTLSSTIRISYMVLPQKLLQRYREQLNFYACTVSNFEQYTLEKFIRLGYLEKHINRMRNYYRGQRDAILQCIRNHKEYKRIKIREEHAGLHFLLEIDTNHTDSWIIEQAKKNGINISCLSQYCLQKENVREHVIVLNYSGINKSVMEDAVGRLFAGFANS